MTNKIKHLAFRFTAPTPVFWKKLQKQLGLFGGLSTVILTGGSMYAYIPTWVISTMGTSTLMSMFIMQFSTDYNKEV